MNKESIDKSYDKTALPVYFSFVCSIMNNQHWCLIVEWPAGCAQTDLTPLTLLKSEKAKKVTNRNELPISTKTFV